MAFTMFGWSESIDTGSTLTNIAAITDQHVTTDGDDILVPTTFKNLMGVYAVGVDLTQVQLTSPSLRASLLLDVSNFDTSSVPEPSSPANFFSLLNSPIALEASEALRAQVINDGASASRVDVFAWAQGEKTALPSGRINTVRLTATTTLTANAWTLVPLTLSQQLERGRYAVVGARFESAGAVAGRLILPGSQNRPGAVAHDAGTDLDVPMFRRGIMEDVWGEFEHRYIPQAEFFSSSADSAETVWLDLIKIGE